MACAAPVDLTPSVPLSHRPPTGRERGEAHPPNFLQPVRCSSGRSALGGFASGPGDQIRCAVTLKPLHVKATLLQEIIEQVESLSES